MHVYCMLSSFVTLLSKKFGQALAAMTLQSNTWAVVLQLATVPGIDVKERTQEPSRAGT